MRNKSVLSENNLFSLLRLLDKSLKYIRNNKDSKIFRKGHQHEKEINQLKFLFAFYYEESLLNV